MQIVYDIEWYRPTVYIRLISLRELCLIFHDAETIRHKCMSPAINDSRGRANGILKLTECKVDLGQEVVGGVAVHCSQGRSEWKRRYILIHILLHLSQDALASVGIEIQ